MEQKSNRRVLFVSCVFSSSNNKNRDEKTKERERERGNLGGEEMCAVYLGVEICSFFSLTGERILGGKHFTGRNTTSLDSVF